MSNNTMVETVETPITETHDETVNLEAAPVAAVEPAPVELPELTHVYQPTDENGMLLGGKQVVKYRTFDELRDKLTEQNILLVRKLREQTRKQRLGIDENEAIPDSAPRFDTPVDFTPRQLSDDERVRLSRDLLDPEKFGEATNMLFEATVGATPAMVGKTLGELQVSNLRLLAKAESDAFVQGTPDYYRCKENFEVITNWMLRKDLAPVRDNFTLAYETLRAAGLLLDAPIVREEAPVVPSIETVTPKVPTTEVAAVEQTPAKTQPVEATPSRITTEEPPQPKRAVSKVASGLTRDRAGDAGVTPQSGYTLREINAMDSETYRKKLNREKGFRETVERLEREAAESRRR